MSLINNLRCRTMSPSIFSHSFPTERNPTNNTFCSAVPFSVQGKKSMCLGRSNRQALAYVTTHKEYNFSIQTMLNTPRKASLKSSFPSKILLHINYKMCATKRQKVLHCIKLSNSASLGKRCSIN